MKTGAFHAAPTAFTCIPADSRSVRSRLARARERLRGRLVRLGVAPALALAAAASAMRAEGATAAPPEALIGKTVRAARRYAGGVSAAAEPGAVPAACGCSRGA